MPENDEMPVRQPLRTQWLRVRHVVADTLLAHPWAYLPAVRVYLRLTGRSQGAAAVTPRTEIVIEGYPRSGNTFAKSAFESAQPREVRIAHHLHASAQIVAGVRWGIPVILLLRDPRSAVASYLVRSRHIPPADALREYIRFHRRVLPFADRIVTASFEQVTGDFGAVIRRVNERYGTQFLAFEHTEENVRRCFDLVEASDRRERGDTRVREHTVARPSAEKEQLKRRVAEQLDDPRLAPLLQDAESLYARLLPHAGAPHGAPPVRDS